MARSRKRYSYRYSHIPIQYLRGEFVIKFKKASLCPLFPYISRPGLFSFHCFEQVIIYNKWKGRSLKRKQEVVITNKYQLLHFNNHNNDLLVLKQMKDAFNRIMPTRSVIIFERLRRERIHYPVLTLLF